MASFIPWISAVCDRQWRRCKFGAAIVGLILISIAPSGLTAQDSLSQRLKSVGIDQNLGAQVPGNLVFRDEQGNAVHLSDYFGKRPIILTLVYFRCPMLCTLTLNDLVRTMKELPSEPGEQFDVLTVSFDPHETPQIAAAKKESYLVSYGRPEAAKGWHFLTGDDNSIQKLTHAVGFHYFFDQPSGQYAHATGVMILNPNGTLSRYFYGIQYDPKDLRLALIDAAGGKTQSLSDQILVLCCQFDLRTGKYTLAVSRLLQVFGGVMTLVVGGGVIWLLRRERRDKTLTG